MLHFSRSQTAAILATVLVICGLPNFVSDETIRGWPEWAQRRITLAPELQGGTSLLLEVDQNDVREHILQNLFRDTRGLLRDARIRLASPLAVRSESIEVRPLAVNFEAALAKLGELTKAFHGIRAAEVTDVGDGLIRVKPTEASIQEYAPITDKSIADIRARLFGVRANIQREGASRVRIQVPRPGPGPFNRLVT